MFELILGQYAFEYGVTTMNEGGGQWSCEIFGLLEGP